MSSALATDVFTPPISLYAEAAGDSLHKIIIGAAIMMKASVITVQITM